MCEFPLGLRGFTQILGVARAPATWINSQMQNHCVQWRLSRWGAPSCWLCLRPANARDSLIPVGAFGLCVRLNSVALILYSQMDLLMFTSVRDLVWGPCKPPAVTLPDGSDLLHHMGPR